MGVLLWKAGAEMASGMSGGDGGGFGSGSRSSSSAELSEWRLRKAGGVRRGGWDPEAFR